VNGAVRIVVADGHPLYRRGLTALLASHAGWTVVAQEDTGAGAVWAVEQHQPDVVVMDLDIPHVEVVEATRQMVAACPAVGVLVLARREDGERLFRALLAGARGHLPKSVDEGAIVRAVTAVVDGEAVLGAVAARRMLEFLGSTPDAAVTSREYEVLNLVAAGWTSADISKVLVLTPAAVRGHIGDILTKVRRAAPEDPAGQTGGVPRTAAPRRRGRRTRERSADRRRPD
jgi:DNA-binding NarL/FixJ family response regulator